MKKIVLITLGFLFLSFGAVGVVIPILPTTPFVILSAACFASSSKKLNDWLTNSKFFGSFITNYRNKTGVPLKYKIITLCFLWASLILSAVLVRIWYVSLILLAVGIGVTIHILLIKTKKENQDDSAKQQPKRRNKRD